MPVKIDRHTIKGKEVHLIVAREGAAETNVSLRKLLEKEFSCVLPDYEIEESDEVISVEGYLAKVRQSIEGLKRWNIRRWLVLGHFAFSRIVMYEDTKVQKWDTHPVGTNLVGALLKGYEQADEASDPPLIASEDYPIDHVEIESLAPFLIQDADASQHSALVDVMKTRNLVLHGPPGTGKSQTITNFIANALGVGKTVLFLSEKQAALNVVKRGLDRAGLGDFCLEVHSDKSSAKTVVASLERRHKLGSARNAAGSEILANTAWQSSRKQIADYVDALHAEDEFGETPFKLMWKSVRHRTTYVQFSDALKSVSMPADLIANVGQMGLARDRLDIFAMSAQTFSDSYGSLESFPWYSTPPQNVMIHALDDMIDALVALQRATVALVAVFDVHGDLGISSAADFSRVADSDIVLSNPPNMQAVATVSSMNIDELTQCIALQAAYLDAEERLAALPAHDLPDATFLSRASQIRSALPHSELSELSASELYRFLENSIERGQTLIDSVEKLRPAMLMFDGSGSDPMSLVDAIVSSIGLASEIDDPTRPWISVVDIDERAFSSLYQRWKGLAQEEHALRDLMPSAGDEPWPAAVDCTAAGEVLRMPGLFRFFRARSSKARVANKISERFRLIAPQREAARIWDRIAVHVEAIDAFNQYPEARTALGRFWKGVESPFEELDAGVQWRQHIRSQLIPLPHGERVASRIIISPSDQLGALSEHEAAAASYRAIRDKTSRTSEDVSIDDTLTRQRTELSSFKAVLQLDVERRLTPSGLSIENLAAIYSARTKLIEAKAAIDGSPLASVVRSLAPGKVEVALTIEALNWIRQVRGARLPSPLSDGLLSLDANRWRENVRSVANSHSTIDAAGSHAWRGAGQYSLRGLEDMDPRSLLPHLHRLLAHRDGLAEFLTLMQQRDELNRLGLGDFLAKSHAAKVPPSQLGDFFNASVTRLMALARRRSSRPLHNLTGNDLDANRRIFAERDRQKIVTDREAVRARLMKRTPRLGERSGSVKTWTQMYLLNNEFQKQTRFVPVRQLLDRADEAILTLKPCFMMSPLSLAKFMPSNASQFDLLIIDEASQMRPEDALGAMLRSKQMVVVGDPKQLPPTNFFDRSSDNPVSDDEATDDIDDESILERCQKVFSDVRRLKWHYRSRCESLIRFSNEEFYEGGLITFPAAKPNSFSIDLIRVDGAYQASRNVAEAERAAEEAVEFMRHFSGSDDASVPTLGLVAININQRDLIQETFRRLSAGDDLVLEYMEKAEKKGEPLFIKNLENVQGDERDYIFISMTYGRETGASQMMQRFGPINSKQGHRRLNVLFSRARVRVGLFTSFGSIDVRPTETSTQGVQVLKRYLEYVEGRGRMRAETIGSEPDSDFEIEVAERVRRSGFLVDLQVGVSGFKIDLGVRHPEHPEMFLAGIECDGASFHSSRSARDRDRLREEVLRGLGWELLRVWSTDWFDNPTAQSEKLVKRLNELRGRPVGLSQGYRLKAAYSSDLHPVEDSGGEDVEALVPEQKASQGEEAAAPSPPSPPPAVAASLPLEVNGTAFIATADAYAALKNFRETVIRAATPGWQPHRSILRDSMIETFLGQRITDPNDWFVRVPQYLRSGTDPLEKRAYLDDICAIVERTSKNGLLSE